MDATPPRDNNRHSNWKAWTALGTVGVGALITGGGIGLEEAGLIDTGARPVRHVKIDPDGAGPRAAEEWRIVRPPGYAEFDPRLLAAKLVESGVTDPDEIARGLAPAEKTLSRNDVFKSLDALDILDGGLSGMVRPRGRDPLPKLAARHEARLSQLQQDILHQNLYKKALLTYRASEEGASFTHKLKVSPRDALLEMLDSFMEMDEGGTACPKDFREVLAAFRETLEKLPPEASWKHINQVTVPAGSLSSYPEGTMINPLTEFYNMAVSLLPGPQANPHADKQVAIEALQAIVRDAAWDDARSLALRAQLASEARKASLPLENTSRLE